MKPYPKYKDSGIEWIGEVPEGWGVLRLKWVCNFLYGESLSAQEREDGTIPVYGSNGIVGNHNRSITKKPCIIVGRKGSFGKVTFSEKKCYPIDTTYYIDCTSTKNYMRWLWYLLPLLKMDEFSRDSAVPGLNREDAYRNIVTLPSSYEQKSIAAYLDRKTTQIDSLISKKQKLIELLKEERAAIINQAITKGLNPDAPMKDSGIEWIGDIPVHWEVKRLKYIATLKYGLGQPPKQVYDGLPLIRATNIERGIIIAKGLIYIDPDDIPYDRDPILRKNDIIIVRSGAYTGDSSIIPEKYHGSIAGYDMVVRSQAINPLFLSYAFLSTYVLIGQLYLHRLRAAQPHLNIEELGSTLIAFPSKEKEQALIAESLYLKCSKIDRTTSKIEKQIDLLKEYRTALISEVVTGKIDVRT